MIDQNEKEVISRAVQNLKHFLFVDVDTLIDDVKMMYPNVGVVVIVNNDDREGAGVPRVTFRTLRTMMLHTRKAQTYSNRGRLYSEVVREVSASFNHVLCVVQDGFVTVKKNRLEFRSE